ncbi:hypothetical protein FBU30_008287 [Linnemannia zychae]|nr:hypothetical protein FBU30_008287 [Linnemannia zychae]
MQQGQQQLAHQQPPANGGNVRSSISHPNLTGGVPGIHPGNRLTPPSPSLSSTRSPQIRPLQQTQQNTGNEQGVHHHQSQQQHPPQHMPNLRPSSSHPHLAQQTGVRPPSAQGSPVLTHQTAIRPPTPLMQQQPRPRPPQVGPHGQPSSPYNQNQQVATGHAVQMDMPSANGAQSTIVAPSPQLRPHLQPSQDMHQQQQRSPGMRPILDQMRQQSLPPHPSQGTGSPQYSQNLNPVQRPPQRPTPPIQHQPQRQQQAPGSVPLSPHRPPTKSPHASSPPNHGHDGQTIDVKPLHGEHGRTASASPHQHNTSTSNQALGDPQLSNEARAHPQPGPPGSTGFPGSHHPSRPLKAPGSPAQRPVGSTEIKLPGPSPSMAVRQASTTQHPQQPPQSHQPPQQSHQPQQPPQPPQQLKQPHQIPHQENIERQEPVALVEPESPPSDSDGAYGEEDDIEGGGSSRQNPPKPPVVAADLPPPPPQAKSAAGGPPQRPPQGPPRGPPKGDGHGTRKLSGAAGTGPVHIMQPSNNPSSPPASAFQIIQPKPRVRPPPGNVNHTPYRPPERPSQAPMMYSQSGQPTFTSPFPVQDEKDSTSAKSLISQGSDAISSSVRPREGGLQKRVVAGDSNATKSDSSASQLQPPPSPKLHGLKGPAILNVSSQRTSSKTKSLKTWAIRGGLIYLGYTAVFNCAPETTGVKGLYCKTTNGIGGLIKPFVAPHYNAHVGPHVDRYIAPVARQGHRIYVKFADPVVQGTLSVAGTVYRSTAKKHVDSAKEKMVSILPYPFKPKSITPNKATKDSSANQEQDQLQFEKVTRQPIHVQDTAFSSDNTNDVVDHHSDGVVDLTESVVDKSEEAIEHVSEVIADEEGPATETSHNVVQEPVQTHEQSAQATEPTTAKETETVSTSIDGEESKHSETSEDANTEENVEQKLIKSDTSEESLFDKMAALKDSLRGLREDVEETAPELKDEEATVESQTHDSVSEDITAPVEEVTHSAESIEPTAESTIDFGDKATTEETEPTSVESSSIPEETVAPPEEIPTIPDETSAIPEEISTIPEETSTDSSEPEKSPVAEEELRESVPVVTEPVVEASHHESKQPQKHDEVEAEAKDETERETEVDAEAKKGVIEEEKIKSEEEKEKEEKRIDAEEVNNEENTSEQQAAPALPSEEVESEAERNSHDEL